MRLHAAGLPGGAEAFRVVEYRNPDPVDQLAALLDTKRVVPASANTMLRRPPTGRKAPVAPAALIW